MEAGSKANHFLGLLKFRNMKLKEKKQTSTHVKKCFFAAVLAFGE